MRHAFVHTVIDDHTRIAYAEVHDDETAATATAVLARAVAWYAARGITVERVLSDNGSAYRSHLWRDTCDQLGITVKKTRPYRPQTNGKIERFHRTMADGWAYAHHYTRDRTTTALPGWLHEYNHHRPHTACGNKPPFTPWSVQRAAARSVRRERGHPLLGLRDEVRRPARCAKVWHRERFEEVRLSAVSRPSARRQG